MTTGHFGTIVKPSKSRNSNEFNYLKHNDRQMRFNNSRDPIYYVFDCIENRPIKTLAKEFVRDSFFEAMNFISKVAG